MANTFTQIYIQIVFDEMTYEKYLFIKPLIWWKSKP